MALSPQESKLLKNSSNAVVSTKSIQAPKSKFEIFFKLISYIFYGFLFGMLAASFKFADTSEQIQVETSSVIAVFAISFLSIAVIYWTFKGDIRRYIPVNYYLVHLLNAILLVLGVFIISWFPIGNGTQAQIKDNIVERQFIVMISMFVWAIVMSLMIIISFARVKKLFPLSWTKIGYTSLILMLFAFTNLFIFLAAINYRDDKTDASTIMQVVGFSIYLVSFILFVLGITYIKVYRDILLGERTDYEIQTIRDWDNVKVLSLISSSIAVITFIIIIFWDQTIKLNSVVYAELIVDVIFVLSYLFVIIVSWKNAKDSSSKGRFTQAFKSIDSIMLLEVIAWIILMKTAIIQGGLISAQGDNVNNEDLFISGAIAYASIIILYLIATIFNVQTPNLKNSSISIATIVGAIFLESVVLAFVSEYDVISHPVWLSLFMVFPLLLGISISLIIRVWMVGKIFKGREQQIIVSNMKSDSNYINEKYKENEELEQQEIKEKELDEENIANIEEEFEANLEKEEEKNILV